MKRAHSTQCSSKMVGQMPCLNTSTTAKRRFYTQVLIAWMPAIALNSLITQKTQQLVFAQAEHKKTAQDLGWQY